MCLGQRNHRYRTCIDQWLTQSARNDVHLVHDTVALPHACPVISIQANSVYLVHKCQSTVCMADIAQFFRWRNRPCEKMINLTRYYVWAAVFTGKCFKISFSKMRLWAVRLMFNGERAFVTIQVLPGHFEKKGGVALLTWPLFTERGGEFVSIFFKRNRWLQRSECCRSGGLNVWNFARFARRSKITWRGWRPLSVINVIQYFNLSWISRFEPFVFTFTSVTYYIPVILWTVSNATILGRPSSELASFSFRWTGSLWRKTCLGARLVRIPWIIDAWLPASE